MDFVLITNSRSSISTENRCWTTPDAFLYWGATNKKRTQATNCVIEDPSHRKGRRHMDQPSITEQEMIEAAELFQTVYPFFIEEIERVEAMRGKLNDFQIMLAVSRAKDAMGTLGWDRRQTINAIFETYMEMYRLHGRREADKWVEETFSYMPPETQGSSQGPEDTQKRIMEISRLIVEKEAELLRIYRELYLLQGWQFPSEPNS
jgi:hypothetical protein